MRPEENGAENSLRDAALEWCFLNGLVVRAKPGAAAPGLNPAALATHAPVTLFPALLPRHAYAEAVRLQPLFNHLIDAIARDHSFLTEVMESLSEVDPFVKACYDIYKKVHAEGSTQRVVLGLHRSDYLLHDDGKSHLQIQQVEVNTISASFASLSTKTADLHRYLQERFPKVYSDRYPSIAIPGPVNTSLKSLPKGIASAFNLYGVKDAIVVMVVQPGERNRFDQRWMEQELQNQYGITLIRKTMADLDKEATLSGDDRKLFLGEKEVAVVYYRSAYTPDDYPTSAEWSARLKLERSHAIKCPNIAYHLVGSKKVQQILAKPNLLERFVDAIVAKTLRTCFTGLYPLDESEEGLAAYKLALADPEKYVMKPQREGGGNNFYGEDIRTELGRLSPAERNAYILMDLIQTPTAKTVMMREGELIEADAISELGIYGIWVSDGSVVHLNEAGGHLLRTKIAASHEGGVAAGFAVLDSFVLGP